MPGKVLVALVAGAHIPVATAQVLSHLRGGPPSSSNSSSSSATIAAQTQPSAPLSAGTSLPLHRAMVVAEAPEPEDAGRGASGSQSAAPQPSASPSRARKSSSSSMVRRAVSSSIWVASNKRPLKPGVPRQGGEGGASDCAAAARGTEHC